MKTKFKLNFITLIFLYTTIFLGGCSKDQTENTVTNISEKVWTLKYLQYHESKFISYYPDINQKVTIEFTENKQLIFDGVCNTGGSTYAIENDKITISPLITTEIYCSNTHWEDITGNGLKEAYLYAISNNELVIFSNSGYNMVFE